MKARVIKPFDTASFDNTAVNMCIFFAVLHERYGFGEKRCLQLLADFDANRDQYNRIAKKEGKWSADVQLNEMMKGIFGNKWKNIFHSMPEERGTWT